MIGPIQPSDKKYSMDANEYKIECLITSSFPHKIKCDGFVLLKPAKYMEYL